MADVLGSHLERAQEYAHSRDISLSREDPFGYGMDGSIWRTSRHSVVKTFERAKNYRDELECYQRFQTAQLDSIAGFALPELIDFDDAFVAIEIKIVRPPYLLDFGKVYLDTPPPYWDDAEIMNHWHVEGREHFGPRWSKVLSLIRILEGFGIYYIDPKPGNISFGDEDELEL